MKRYKEVTGLSLETCLERILEHITPIRETEQLPLSQAGGRILARDIYAEEAVPSFDRSAMDGYAVQAEDLEGVSDSSPVRLKVVGEILAGMDADGYRGRMGTAVRIMTGAPVPDGFNAVVKQEDTDQGDDEVCVFHSVREGENICPAGEEIGKGVLAVPAGARLGRVELGLLSSLGLHMVEVRRPLRVSLLSTGSELLAPGEAPAPGKIYGSIGVMLRYSVERMGLSVVSEELCADDEALLSEKLKAAARQADVVITTGGVSVGKRDLIPGVLDGLGAELLFTRALIQPGTPTMASLYDGRIVLSLSGNPYAALANFDYYFPHMAAAYMGCREFLPVIKKAVLADPYPKVNNRRRLIRAREEDGRVYLPAESHKASVFGNMASCNCYMDLEAGRKAEPGDEVRVIKWG